MDRIDAFNKIRFDGKPIATPGSLNFTAIIPAGDSKVAIWFVDRMQKLGILRDTFLLAMEFGYKSKGNKEQTPLRKVYEIILSRKHTREVDSYEFMQAANYLKKYGIWKKFYNL